jgi:hypothetical protein
MASVLQDWVQALGLRHQGVLVAAVRGCDSVPKEDPSKAFVRCYRAVVLNSHCGDPARAKSFIQAVDDIELTRRFLALRGSFDHYPIHYVMHLVHAMEIVGYKHPDIQTGITWTGFYAEMCEKLHLQTESPAQLDERLGADEETFASRI